MRSELVCALIFSITLSVFISCSELDRDNILDPKNPDSKRESVVLVEAFVNTADDSEYNFYALQALESLQAMHQDRLIIVEIHKNVTGAPDNLALPENEIYHNVYTIDYLLEPGRNKGVPDLYLNGAANRVQGAFDISNTIDRMQAIISNLFLEEGNFTIESEAQYTGSQVEGKYRVARLGNQRSDDMILRIYVTYNAENMVSGSGKRTVSAIKEIPISAIGSGEYIEEEFDINVPASHAERIIFVLFDESKLMVLHAFEEEVL